MAGEDAGDERAGGPPPDPADRAWVHPSELTAFVATSRREPPPRARIFGALALVAAVTGAGVLAAVLSRSPTRTNDDVLARPAAVRLLVAATTPSVVKVVAARPDGPSVASGVSIGDGQVLTSMRALEGSVAVVVAAGDRMIAATKAGTDPVTELALLRVPYDAVPAVKLGSARGLEAGQAVIGIAASEGAHWVDVGKVATLDRAFESTNGTVVPGLVDTDLTAAHEHAGGALVDRRGRLVGLLVVPPLVSTAGLALPVEDALAVARELEKSGRARHGWMGVTVADATGRSGGGAEVREVVSGSPAERAGLRTGDVVVSIADDHGPIAISSMERLMAEVRRHRPGERLVVGVYRNKGELHVTVALGDRPEIRPVAAATVEREGS